MTSTPPLAAGDAITIRSRLFFASSSYSRPARTTKVSPSSVVK